MAPRTRRTGAPITRVMAGGAMVPTSSAAGAAVPLVDVAVSVYAPGAGSANAKLPRAPEVVVVTAGGSSGPEAALATSATTAPSIGRLSLPTTRPPMTGACTCAGNGARSTSPAGACAVSGDRAGAGVVTGA